MNKESNPKFNRKKFIKRVIIPIVVLMLASVSVFAYNNASEIYKRYNLLNFNKQKVNNAEAGKNPDTQLNSTPEPSPTPDPKKIRAEELKKVFENIKVKALYLTGWTMGNTSNIEHYVNLANKTEINAYVIDIKDDDGYVGYESSVPEVRNAKAWQNKYDVNKVIEELHNNNIYVIGRVVCFKDPVYSSKRPDLAVKNSGGGLWRDNKGLSWLNPYNKDSWSYLVNISKEAIEKGFDEIQFDYIRFANDGRTANMNFGEVTEKKYEIINDFLSYVKKEIPNTKISADVFGIICESQGDREGIGQYLELIGKDVDFISPMVYPSHYALGQIVNNVQFAKPDLDPYGVVYNSIVKAKNRISGVPDYKASIRPYLQDFTATWLGKGNYQSYGINQVQQQIKAVKDAGLNEWIFWDASNKYSEDAFEKNNG